MNRVSLRIILQLRPLLGGLIFIILLLASARTSAAADSKKAHFLALLPLSGTGADQGAWCRQGLVLAEEELRSQGITNFIVDYEDTRGDPRLALDVLHRTLAGLDASNSRGVSPSSPLTAVLTWGSGVAMVLTPELNKRGIIQMGVATATSEYRSIGDFTFRVYHSAEKEGEFIAREISKVPLQLKVALLAINNDYGLQIAEAIKARLPHPPVFDDVFDPGTTDFRTQLLRIKTSGAGVLILVAYPSEGAIVLKQRKELNAEVPVISAGAIYGGNNFFDLVGSSAEGVRIVLPKPSESARARTFSEKYTKKFKEPISVVTHYPARSFDGLMLLGQALRACGAPDAECIKNELLKVKDYEGASSLISFDEAGDIVYELRLFEISGKNFLEAGSIN